MASANFGGTALPMMRAVSLKVEVVNL